MGRTFQRARRPEQKAERAEQLLAAARAMLREELDTSRLSLNALARRAGMAKSNVYRYFESRESVLLALLLDGIRDWRDHVLVGLGDIDRGGSLDARLEAMVGTISESIASRPVLCHLTSVLPSVLEHNVSFDSVRAFKLESVEVASHVATAMHDVVPELSVEKHARLVFHCNTLVVGGWPLARPSAVACEVIAEVEGLDTFRHEFEEDLHEAVLLMARGMLGRVNAEVPCGPTKAR